MTGLAREHVTRGFRTMCLLDALCAGGGRAMSTPQLCEAAGWSRQCTTGALELLVERGLATKETRQMVAMHPPIWMSWWTPTPAGLAWPARTVPPSPHGMLLLRLVCRKPGARSDVLAEAFLGVADRNTTRSVVATAKLLADAGLVAITPVKHPRGRYNIYAPTPLLSAFASVIVASELSGGGQDGKEAAVRSRVAAGPGAVGPDVAGHPRAVPIAGTVAGPRRVHREPVRHE